MGAVIRIVVRLMASVVAAILALWGREAAFSKVEKLTKETPKPAPAADETFSTVPEKGDSRRPITQGPPDNSP